MLKDSTGAPWCSHHRSQCTDACWHTCHTSQQDDVKQNKSIGQKWRTGRGSSLTTISIFPSLFTHAQRHTGSEDRKPIYQTCGRGRSHGTGSTGHNLEKAMLCSKCMQEGQLLGVKFLGLPTVSLSAQGTRSANMVSQNKAGELSPFRIHFSYLKSNILSLPKQVTVKQRFVWCGTSLTMLATGTQKAAKWGLSTLGRAADMTTHKFQRAGYININSWIACIFLKSH